MYVEFSPTESVFKYLISQIHFKRDTPFGCHLGFRYGNHFGKYISKIELGTLLLTPIKIE